MIKLVVDSTCELSIEEAEKLGIVLIPMKVTIDDDEYLVGVNLTSEAFYEKLSTCKNLPKTTQINYVEYMDAIKPIIDGGDEVLAMCLSSGISGTFNSLRMACEDINSPHVRCLDSQTASFAFKALVYEALKLIKKGLTLDELEKEVECLRDKLKIFAVIDNVKYLIKGGRLSLAKGMLATALNIKPIVTVRNKVVEMIGKAVGFSLAMKNIFKLIINVDTTKEMYYAHSNDEEKAEKFHDMILQTLGLDFKPSGNIGPIIGTHVGPGCVGVAYFEK